MLNEEREDLTLIIDGMNIFISNFVVNPTLNANGIHVGGMFGTIKSILLLIRKFNPKRVIVAWDGNNGSTRRRKQYSDYKSGRKMALNRSQFGYDHENNAKSLREQLMRIVEYLDNLPILQLSIDNVEADDVIAFLSKYVNGRKIIVTADNDMMQLISNDVQLFRNNTKILYDYHKFLGEYGILPENYIIVKCLMGDRSDNIDKVLGIGKETVKKYFGFLKENVYTINDFKTKVSEIDNKPKAISKLCDNWEIFDRNYDLMQLSDPNISGATISHIRNIYDNFQPKLNIQKLELMMYNDGIKIEDKNKLGSFTLNSLLKWQ